MGLPDGPISPGMVNAYHNCIEHCRDVLKIEEEIENKILGALFSAPTIEESLRLVDQLNVSVRLLNNDLSELKKFNDQDENRTLFQHAAINTAQEALLKIAEYRAKLEPLLAKPQAPTTPLAQVRNLEVYTASYPKLMEQINALKSQGSLSPEERHTMHQYMEKAAEILEAKGNAIEAYSLRKEIAEMLSPTSQHVLLSDIKDYPTDSRSSNQSGFDGGTVKRGVLSFSRRNYVDDEKKMQLRLHLSGPYEQKIKHLCTSMQENPNLLQNFQSNLPSSIQGTVTIEEVVNGYEGRPAPIGQEPGNFSQDLECGMVMGKALKVHFAGIGSVIIGNDDSVISMKQRVVVEVDGKINPELALAQMHAMMTMLGLGPVLEKETQEEEERKKIALLLHTFEPQMAYRLQQDMKFYELSVENLIKEIIDINPNMNSIFDAYLTDKELFKKVELGENYQALAVADLAEKMRKKGALGFMVGFSGGTNTMMRILKSGFSCSQQRFEKGLMTGGTSPGEDHRRGGAGSVFVRLVTNNMLYSRLGSTVANYPYSGDLQFIVDLSAIERGGYVYATDHYGSKMPEDYAERPTLLAISEKLGAASRPDNEVMLPELLPPQKIKHILVKSASAKANLIEDLIREGFAEQKSDETGTKTYLKGNIPLGGAGSEVSLEEFIVTGEKFVKTMWTK